MELKVIVNMNTIPGLLDMTRAMIRNLGEGVPTDLLGLMNETIKLGADITHRGATKKLYQAWRVQQNKYSFTIRNLMPYAVEEFNRGGDKVAGPPPLGPHDPRPQMFDLISANAQSVVEKAILAGATR